MVDLQTENIKSSYDQMMKVTEQFIVTASYISKICFDTLPNERISNQIEYMPAVYVSADLKDKLKNSTVTLMPPKPDTDVSMLKEVDLPSAFHHAFLRESSVKEFYSHNIERTDQKAHEDTNCQPLADMMLNNFVAHFDEEKESDSFAHQRLAMIHVLNQMRHKIHGENNQMLIHQLLNNCEDQVTTMTNSCHTFCRDVLAAETKTFAVKYVA